MTNASAVVNVVASRYGAAVTADRVYELLERLANLMRAEERALGAEAGLQPVHLHVLAYLGRANRYSDTPIAVAEYLGSTKGTVSQSIAVLQEKGLIATADDGDDARKVHLRLSAKGRRFVDRLLPPAVLVDGLQSFGRGGPLADQLAELLLGMQRARGSRTFGVCRGCRHFRRADGGGVCGLTGEALRSEETQRVCREHEPGQA